MFLELLYSSSWNPLQLCGQPASLLLTEDCSKLYILCLSAIKMWFGGPEWLFIYERHIVLQKRDNIFKQVKRLSSCRCSRRVTVQSIRCPRLLSDCVEQKWSVLDLCFLFFKQDWCGHFLVIQIKKREGDPDRVRLAGSWIKASFKTVKIKAWQMQEVRRLNVKQTGAGRIAVRIHRNGERCGQGIQYRNRMTLWEGKISRPYLMGTLLLIT